MKKKYQILFSLVFVIAFIGAFRLSFYDYVIEQTIYSSIKKNNLWIILFGSILFFTIFLFKNILGIKLSITPKSFVAKRSLEIIFSVVWLFVFLGLATGTFLFLDLILKNKGKFIITGTINQKYILSGKGSSYFILVKSSSPFNNIPIKVNKKIYIKLNAGNSFSKEFSESHFGIITSNEK